MIELTDIRSGDTVTIEDRQRNLATGELRRDGDQLTLTAFAAKLPVLRKNRNDEWAPVRGVKVVAHMAQLTP